MERIWNWIKRHPYWTSFGVIAATSTVIYFENERRRRIELEERIRRNKEESERRDRLRREKEMQKEPETENPQSNSIVRTLIPTFVSEAYIKGSFENFSLHSFINKWTIILFTSIDPENYQNRETFEILRNFLITIDENVSIFEHKNVEVVIILQENKNFIKDFSDSPRNEGGLGGFSFPLISDINSTLFNLFGIKFSSEGINIIIADDEKYLRDKKYLPIGDDMMNIDSLIDFVESNRL